MSKGISLQRFLKDADERVKKAAAEALNKASKQLESEIKGNMASQGIHSRTGNLASSITATKADEKHLNIVVKSEVYKNIPKKPNKNRRKWGKQSIRYASRGVPYGRILEFSPRIKKPFFYTAWYKNRRQIKEEIIKAIGDAWNNG